MPLKILIFAGLVCLAAILPSAGDGSSAEESETILQAVLDLQCFEMFFHPESAGRVPVVFLKNTVVESAVHLTRFDTEVIFLSKLEIESKRIEAYVEVTRFEVHGDKAEVDFSYSIEGAHLVAEATKTASGWVANCVRVYET